MNNQEAGSIRSASFGSGWTSRAARVALACGTSCSRAGRHETHHELNNVYQREERGSFKTSTHTPTTVNRSSPASKSTCRVSFWGTPLCFLTVIAFTMMSYSCFVARALVTMEGLGNQGKSTVAGVIPRSTCSKSCLQRATIWGSSAISVHVRHRTVAWNAS